MSDTPAAATAPHVDVLLDNDDRRLRHAWHPVARSVDVTAAGLSVRLAGEDYTLRRTGDRTHQGRIPEGRLPEGRMLEGRIRQGHGRENDPYDHVEVVAGSAWGIQELYGLVWLAQDEPVADLPHIGEWFDPAYHSGVLTRHTTVGAGVVIDNFLDVTHFSYLHRQSFGRSRPVTDDGYAISLAGGQVVLTHDTVLQEGRRNNEGGLGQRRIATYTYSPPYTTHLQMMFPEDGALAASTIFCQPEAHDSTRIYVLVMVPTTDTGIDEQIAFSDRVLAEDLVIVERMADPRLCLSVKSELHTRADRASIEMRRRLVKFLAECAAVQDAAVQDAATGDHSETPASPGGQAVADARALLHESARA